MEERLKRRLIGGAVLVSLVVIFVPMMLEDRGSTERNFGSSQIPEMPKALQQAPNTQSVLPEPIARNEPVVPEPKPEPEPQPEPVPEPQPEPEPKKAEPDIPAQVQKYGKIERETPTAWLIQVASFSQRKNADNLVERMHKAGMPVEVKPVRIGGKQLYRVQMMPQLDKQEAESLVKKIRKKFGLEASVVRYAG